jgi:hypothetical protein
MVMFPDMQSIGQMHSMTDNEQPKPVATTDEITLSPDAESQLKELTSFLYDEGEPAKGCELSEEAAIELALTHFPNKPYCLVAQWRRITLDISEKDEKDIRDAGCRPVLVYASKVLADSHRRFRRGNWVRSTLQVSFTHGCLFETPNTVYVLMGDGSLKTEKPDVVMSIF